MTGLQRHLLPFVVFVTGASVLIVEVLAVRVLSPYYGNTIFTVSSVISVILLALSVGYYAGGVLADRRPSLRWFFAIIAASGLLLLLFHYLGALVLPWLGERLSIASGPLVSSTILFLLPALFLGTLSPYAVKLQSLHFPEQGVGRVAGAIFFWSTLGSISGSLLAGFVLIPNFGIDPTLTVVGVLLFLLGLVPLAALRTRPTRLAALLVPFALVFAIPALTPAPVAAGETTIYQEDGVYQRISIYDGSYFDRPVRFLLLDRSESGAMFLDSDDPTELVYDYTKYYSLYKIFTPQVRRALVLGGGAYSIPKALLSELPDAEVDVAEIEPWFFDLAKQYFAVTDSPRLHNHVQDGRRFLQDARTPYDLIFGDVYYSYFSVPSHFTTQEFFALAKARLAPGGVFIANMIGDLSRQQPSLIMAEIKTFKTVFPNSYFFAVESVAKNDFIQNITLVGYNSDRVVDVAAPPVTTHPDELIRFLRYRALDIDRRYELSAYPVLTDDYAPVDFLTARVLQRSLDGVTELDGAEMLALEQQQRRYGDARIGGPGHARRRDLLLAEMGTLAEVIRQPWTITGPDGPVELVNVIGRIFGSEARRVVLAAPNDASAAVAILMELTRYLIHSPQRPAVGIDIVFFERADGDPAGARQFAARLGEAYNEEEWGVDPPIAAVVLDQVCREGLRVAREPSSEATASKHVDDVWSVGTAVAGDMFTSDTGKPVRGGHTELAAAGIPSVLITDVEPGSPGEPCSAQTLATVAEVLRRYVMTELDNPR